MKNGSKKHYTRRRPAHPDDAHTKAKRFFKRKGRKRVRRDLKKSLKEKGE